jgi:hypothetical protein
MDKLVNKGNHLKQLLRRKEKLELMLSKTNNEIEWLKAEISIVNEEEIIATNGIDPEDSSTDGWKKALKIAGLSIEEVEDFINRDTNHPSTSFPKK